MIEFSQKKTAVFHFMKNRFQEREFSFLSTRVRKSRLMSQYPEPSPSYIYPSKTHHLHIYSNIFSKYSFEEAMFPDSIYIDHHLHVYINIYPSNRSFMCPENTQFKKIIFQKPIMYLPLIFSLMFL